MSKTKKIEVKKELISKINSIDPVANFILKDFYKDILKESTLRELTDTEQRFVSQLELTYIDAKEDPENVVNELLDEVYEILKEDVAGEDKDNRLYSVLEKVIFLNAREKVFKKFFDDIEEVICSVLQLDYSKQLEGLEINDREVNIFNYAAAALNMIVDKMSTSCLSTKVVNYVTEQLGRVMIVVTDSSNKIRYVNKYVEQLVGAEKGALIDEDLSKLLELESSEGGGKVFFKGVKENYRLMRPMTEVEDSSEIIEKVLLIR